MTLPDDIARCNGHALDASCPLRATCLRHTEPVSDGRYVWYVHPQIPGPCIYYMPTAERSEAPEPSPAKGPIDVTRKLILPEGFGP